MTKVYSVVTLINNYGPEIESSYFDHNKAIDRLHELCNYYNEEMRNGHIPAAELHEPYEVDEKAETIFYPIKYKDYPKLKHTITISWIRELEVQ